MTVVLEKVTQDGLVALKNLFEFGAYDLSELNGSNVNENGVYLTNNKCQDWYEDPNYSMFFNELMDSWRAL